MLGIHYRWYILVSVQLVQRSNVQTDRQLNRRGKYKLLYDFQPDIRLFDRKGFHLCKDLHSFGFDNFLVGYSHRSICIQHLSMVLLKINQS